MIVTGRARRKRPKAAQPVEIKAPRVVRTTPKGRAWWLRELEPDTDADARVEAFLLRMGLKLPDDWAS